MTGNYWTDRTKRVSRRRLLQASATGGLGLAAAALIGCGGDDDDDTVAATTAPTQAPGGAAATAAPTQAVATGPPQGGTFRWRIIGDPPSWSVLRASGATTALNSPSYDKLLDLKTGPGIGQTEVSPFPVLAETMPEVTPDGLEYVYKIHPNVNFQNLPPVNGRALTAEDVKFSVDLYRTTGSFARDFGIVESVEAIDDVTIRVKLSGPWSPLVNLSAGHYGWRIVPNEIMKDDIDLTTTIGSGPWIRTEWLQGNRITYERNPDYFRGTDGAFLEKMTALIIPTPPSSAAAFRSDEIDLLGAGALSCVEAEDLAKQVEGSGATVTSYPGRSGWFAFNTSKPPFDDVRVRRAVALAYDREAETNSIYCGEAVVTGLIPLAEGLHAEDSSAFPESTDFLRLDRTESKALLAAAGYPDGFKSDVSWTPRYGQVYQFAMELMIGQMAQVGIDLEPISYEYGKWIQDIYRGEYDFDGIMWGPGRYYADADPYIAYWLHPDGIANQSRVDDPEMNALIAAQRAELNPEARWEIIHDIQRLEAVNQYYVWRGDGNDLSFTQEWVQDYSLHSGYDLKEYDHIWDKRLS